MKLLCYTLSMYLQVSFKTFNCHLFFCGVCNSFLNHYIDQSVFWPVRQPEMAPENFTQLKRFMKLLMVPPLVSQCSHVSTVQLSFVKFLITLVVNIFWPVRQPDTAPANFARLVLCSSGGNLWSEAPYFSFYLTLFHVISCS